jgi:hypothetical protein
VVKKVVTEVDTEDAEAEEEPIIDLRLSKVPKEKLLLREKAKRITTMVTRVILTDTKENKENSIINMTEEMELAEEEKAQERMVTAEETGEVIDKSTRRRAKKSKK